MFGKRRGREIDPARAAQKWREYEAMRERQREQQIPLEREWHARRQEEEARAAAEQAEQAQAQRVLKQAQDLVGQLDSAIDCAARHYAAAIQWLQEADTHSRGAQYAWERTLFVSFWEHIEAATQALNSHRIALHHIGDWLDRHQRAYDELTNLSPAQASIAPAMPAQTAEITQSTKANDIATDVETLFNKAQANYQFASIYEQRRNTAAIIDGFSSLAAATSRMSATLSFEYSALRQTFERATTSRAYDPRIATANTVLRALPLR